MAASQKFLQNFPNKKRGFNVNPLRFPQLHILFAYSVCRRRNELQTHNQPQFSGIFLAPQAQLLLSL